MYGIAFGYYLKKEMANIDDKKGQERQSAGEFQSDAQKPANKHLADPDHIITDEDFANVRVGMTPPPDEPTRQAVEDAEEKIADRKSDSEDDTLPGAQKITPWDVVT